MRYKRDKRKCIYKFHDVKFKFEINYIDNDKSGYVIWWCRFKVTNVYVFRLSPVLESTRNLFQIKFLIIIFDMTVFTASIALEVAFVFFLYNIKKRKNNFINKFAFYFILFPLFIFPALLNQRFIMKSFFKKVDAKSNIRVSVELYRANSIPLLFKQIPLLVIEVVEEGGNIKSVGQFVVDPSKIASKTTELVKVICNIIVILNSKLFKLGEKIVLSTFITNLILDDNNIVSFFSILSGLDLNADAFTKLSIKKLIGDPETISIRLPIIIIYDISKYIYMKILENPLNKSNDNAIFVIIFVDIIHFLRLVKNFFNANKKVKNIVSFRLTLKFTLPNNEVNFTA
ncbi:MAG: hypothetical protein CL912_14730 [Deltaproteobacteria bacterium]|nr:hypothetical protein [Deltaproteobacteria bacterium]